MEAAKVEVKFGEWIQAGITLWKDNLGTLVVAFIIALIVSVVTVGILAGPMMAGLSMIVLRLIDKQEPKPQAGDVFNGFQFFLPAFLFILTVAIVMFVLSFILGKLGFLGMMLMQIVNLVLTPLLLFVVFLIVDKKMDFWSAIMESVNVGKANFVSLLILGVVAGVLGMIGLIGCIIGVLITAPISTCIIGVAYREMVAPTAAPVAPTTTV